MCGLVALVRRGDNDCTEQLRQGLETIHHRGPDDQGIWVACSKTTSAYYTISFGHVRLSILDLSDAGHQPMTSDDGELTVVFNGEIYNYLELRQELAAAGHHFHTGSDTEVVLHAYRAWGERCVERFIGMWAIALWDGETLFLSRDRLGKKPLYFHHDPAAGLLALASEIKALRPLSGVPWAPDEETVYRFLAFGEMEHGGSTFFAGIREFPAGSTAMFRPGDATLTPRPFWTLDVGPLELSEDEAVARVEELLIDSLRLRLRSDAPLGLSLSGGLDSTLLLGLMNEVGAEQPDVFSTAYAEKGYNETPYLKIASDSLGCRPYTAQSGVGEFRRDFERFIFHLDQPSKLPGPYSQFRVVDLASQRVKVLIDGQGADELFGGYLYFLPAAWHEQSLLDHLRYAPDLLATAFGNLHMLAQYSPDRIVERLIGRAAKSATRFIRPEWSEALRQPRPRWEKTRRTPLNAVLRDSVLRTSLPPLLRYGDRVTMAFGVENRCPFLDHRLVKLVAALPARFKIRGGTTKWLLRRIARGRVPTAISERRSKMGFPTPVGVWLRGPLAGDAKQWLESYGANTTFARWIELSAASRLLAEHIAGRGEHQAALWRILAVGAWATGAGW